MFKLDLSPTYFAPASIQMLDGDGALTTHQFDLLFKRMNADDLADLLSEHRSQDEKILLERDLDKRKKLEKASDVKAKQLITRVVVGWRGVTGADDTDLPFSADNLARFLRIVGMQGVILTAFFESLKPEKSAALATKN